MKSLQDQDDRASILRSEAPFDAVVEPVDDTFARTLAEVIVGFHGAAGLCQTNARKSPIGRIRSLRAEDQAMRLRHSARAAGPIHWLRRCTRKPCQSFCLKLIIAPGSLAIGRRRRRLPIRILRS